MADGEASSSEGPEWLRTGIGSSTRDAITVGGRDLPGQVMGELTLTELAILLVTGREPTGAQRRIVDAVLVSLADHGLTPSALAARLTYTGAPEAIQGAVAAGLLGGELVQARHAGILDAMDGMSETGHAPAGTTAFVDGRFRDPP